MIRKKGGESGSLISRRIFAVFISSYCGLGMHGVWLGLGFVCWLMHRPLQIFLDIRYYSLDRRTS